MFALVEIKMITLYISIIAYDGCHTTLYRLDVFRGMTVCFMIIVNTPGNGATMFSFTTCTMEWLYTH